MKKLVLFSGILSIASLVSCIEYNAVDADPKSYPPRQQKDAYYQQAYRAVSERAGARGYDTAKNVILFVGDGMGISTVTAARIYAGQKRGLDGESYKLTMETLPWAALSKTYSHDSQVSDSASTATAMVAGVKTRSRMLGLTSDAAFGNCASAENAGTDSIFEIAEFSGLSTGFVSTARITHATPAATYAESPNRDWEDNSTSRGGCKDIASQLVDWPAGDGIEVALGGGLRHFLPESKDGRRTDGRDLTEEWETKSEKHVFVSQLDEFTNLNFSTDINVLGLFNDSHLNYELDRITQEIPEPSISEMTRAAITRLSQNKKGFVLLVEGGRIDHGHHAGNAVRALEDTDAFDQAVAVALEMTSREDTLIIVTADHSHTLTIAGYPRRNNPILGKVVYPGGTPAKGLDGKPYTALGYANGPGSICNVKSCERRDLSDINTESQNFRQPAYIPMGSETHAGEDVAIFASGPGANLFSGVMEQNEIFHVIGTATGLVANPPETANQYDR